MIPRLLFLLAGILLALASCKRSDEPEPAGITQRISAFRNYACYGGTVTRYDFNGGQVFVFADSCGWPDAGYAVTDINGRDVCYLGGYGGLATCQGIRFDSNARNPSRVFQKQ